MGRYSYSDRNIIEETPRLSIQAVVKSRILNIKNNNSAFIASVNYQVDGFLVTSYNNGNNSYSLQIQYNWMDQPKETICEITSIPCNYGGIRYYFICPMTEKKVTTLYVGDFGVMASRQHLKLVYRLSRFHRDATEELYRSNNHRIKADEYRLLGRPRKAKKKDLQATHYRRIAYTNLTTYLKKKNEILKKKYPYIHAE